MTNVLTILSLASLLTALFPAFLLLRGRRRDLMVLLVLWALCTTVIVLWHVYAYLTADPSEKEFVFSFWFYSAIVSHLLASAIAGSFILPKALKSEQPLKTGWALLYSFLTSLLMAPIGFYMWAFAAQYSEDEHPIQLVIGSYLFMFVSPNLWAIAILVTAMSALTLFIMRRFESA
jgi:hypothetical protein